jgi:hypothetical protein
MKKLVTALAIAACVGLAAAITNDPVGNVATGLARGAIGGLILGSNVSPSVPIDVQSRLLLWSSNCNEQEQCRLVSTALTDE